MRYAWRVVPALLCTPWVVSAQQAVPTAWAQVSDAIASPAQAPWLGAWSPLRPIVDLSRGEHRAPGVIGLAMPRAVAGPFAVAGAPGSLVRDLAHADSTRWGTVGIASLQQSGALRRPLDAAQASALRLDGMGWQPVGRRGVVIGSFSLDQEQLDPSGLTSRIAPYTSSPFVLADSVSPPMQRSRARVEGGLGLRLGAWGVGAVAGLDAREHNSVEFPVRRTGRQAVPAAAVGIERTWRPLALRVGAFGRWSEPVETQLLSASPRATRYYAIQGLDEPVGYPLSEQLTALSRIQRRAMAGGATAALRVAGADVALVWERGQRAEDQFFSPLQATRPTDRWRATGAAWRGVVQRSAGSRVQLQAVVAHESLDGEAVRADLTGLAMNAAESRSAAEGEVRWRWSESLLLGVSGGLLAHDWSLVDFVAQTTARIERTAPFGAGEVLWQHDAWQFTLGAGVAATSATGRVPPVASQQENYRRFVAPALAYDAASVRSSAAWLRVARRVGGTAIDVTLRGERATAGASDEPRTQLAGTREGWTVRIGVRP